MKKKGREITEIGNYGYRNFRRYMKKEDRWYDLKSPLGLAEGLDNSKALFRIISFDGLLQMLNEHANYLVKTSLWEDVYENFILKEKFNGEGKEMAMNSLANMFYGQCWTSKKTSDAMWRIYSPDKKSVRIKTRLGKLYNMITPNDGAIIVGRVKYYSQAKIEEDIRFLPVLTKGEIVSLIIQSLFTKRNSFSHEAEYRVIYIANPQKEIIDVSAKQFFIDPFNFIENIYFDPRADDAYVERCKKILTNAFKYPKTRIKKSSLYSFNSQQINFANKYGKSDWDMAIQNSIKYL